ncbi:hypothetical protein LTR84_005826 [Exophiala bonariae]|uniref:Uncharacterized protein n=1 Tax=Exophiala bonariae TaxID=1690606 RepID=A0AAV9N2B3_9EURO|nr:hypothetical protein LTR84_005826 [Exophiala bonariae]
MSNQTGKAMPSYKHARHISSLMKEPLIESTIEDQEPLHPPARPRHASISNSNLIHKHARHISSLMKPLPADASITTTDDSKSEQPSAAQAKSTPLSSIAYSIWPIPHVNYENISGRLSKPFGHHSNYHDLENNSIASSREKIPSVNVTPASSIEGILPLIEDQLGSEWIPRMLRPRFSFTLATSFAGLFLMLELLDILDRKRDGFATSSGIASFVNYLPSMIVVLLALFWEMVLKNLKEVGPWSLMAMRWTRADEGLYSVNYIDTLDFRGFLMSVKLRQFGITLGYTGAILCGALVPFANTLFFTDPIPRMMTTPNSLFRTSQLLVNDTLTGVKASGRNSAAFDPQSFINYMAIQKENFALPTWTIEQRALESFNLTASSSAQLFSREENITLSATTSAFNINVTCDPISWVLSDAVANSNSSLTQTRLVPDLEDLSKANCTIRPQDYPQLSFDPRNLTAWFNYTTCGDYQCPGYSADDSPTNPPNCGDQQSADLRLVLNVWNPEVFDGNLLSLPNESAAIPSLLCKIEMFTDEYHVHVDARKGRLIDIARAPISSRKLSIKNQESIVLKINQYLKQNTEVFGDGPDENDFRFPVEVFLDEPLSEPVFCNPSEYFKNSEMEYFPGAVRPSSDFTTAVGIDRFILMMSQGNNLRIANYAKDITEMQKDMSGLLQGLVSQIVNVEYRYGDAVEMEGLVMVSATIMHLRQVSLRTLQVIMTLMTVITILTSTKLRPRTHLRTDPRSLGAMAMLLSRSDTIEKLLRDTGGLSERSFLSQLSGQYIRTTLEDGRTILELQDSQRYSKMLHSLNKRRDSTPTPWHHTALLLTYRTVLLGAIAFMILILGISWWRSEKTAGIAPTSGEGNHPIIYFIPILLVLLTYAVSAVDGPVQCMQPYIQVAAKSLKPKAGLDFSPITYSPFTTDYRSLKHSRNSLSFLTLGLHLLVPAIKVAVASLLFNALRQSFIPTLVPIDSSLVSNLDTYNLTTLQNSGAQEEILRSRAMTLIQSSAEFLVKTSPVGLVDGLVFSNVTNRISNEEIDSILDTGSDMNIRIPAIQVTPACRFFGTSDYRNMTPSGEVDGNPTIDIICDTGLGLARCPSQAVDRMFTGTSSRNSTDETSYFWNRDSLVGSPNSENTPDSPEIVGSEVFQNVTTFLLAKANQADSTVPGFEITNIASFWCNIKYTAIDINVTVSRPRRAALGIQRTLPLVVKSYDANSITPILDQAAYNISHLNWTNINDLSSLRSIRPLNGRNLLYSIIKRWNPRVTDDDFVKSPRLLAQGGSKVLRYFAAVMIDQSRPFVEAMSAAQSQAAIPEAQVQTARLRLIQSKGTTITLQSLLGALIFCILVMGFGVNSKKITLFKAPSSIGSQIGLVAGSELVRIARDEDIRRKNFGDEITGKIGEDALWRAWDGFLVNLGWWERSQARSVNLARSELEVDTFIRGGNVDRGEKRFGIDVGEAERNP